MRKNNRKREPKNVGYSPQCLDATSGYLDGYWQSEKYFEAIADTIRSDFRFKLLKGKENLALQERIASEPCVSVHVRRGDYLTIPSLAGICSVEYYTQALARVDACAPGGTRVIFSDDIPYCRELFGSRDAVYVDWNRKENSWMDMALMGLCKHHIIANSSFSWWGAWLGECWDGITIAPRHWYAAESNTRNPYICPERWELIE